MEHKTKLSLSSQDSFPSGHILLMTWEVLKRFVSIGFQASNQFYSPPLNLLQA